MKDVILYGLFGLIVISVIIVFLFFGYPVIISEQACGVENCHGMDVLCGPNVPQACTENYQVGDRCRQYASCQIVGGDCSLVAGDLFDACKRCVGECLSGNDSIEIFSCESLC